jgi:hypothetical protein
MISVHGLIAIPLWLNRRNVCTNHLLPLATPFIALLKKEPQVRVLKGTCLQYQSQRFLGHGEHSSMLITARLRAYQFLFQDPESSAEFGLSAQGRACLPVGACTSDDSYQACQARHRRQGVRTLVRISQFPQRLSTQYSTMISINCIHPTILNSALSDLRSNGRDKARGTSCTFRLHSLLAAGQLVP